MQSERPYWNMEMEQMLNTPEMKVLQLERLKKMLARMKDNAPFYTKMFKKVGLDPEKLAGFEEYRDKIQPFDKAALRQLVIEAGGDILQAIDQIMPVSIDDIDYFGTTTGTTGIPTPYPLTNFDINNLWGEAMARGAWRSGIRSNDRVLWTFALSMVIAGVPTMMGMQNLGCTMLPVGAEAKSERILMIQNLFKGTVFAGTPSLAEYLIEQAPKYLHKKVGELGFKALICGGEPGAGIPQVKHKLEKAYGCRIFDAGAGFGFSCDADDYEGMHWVADDICYYELVDPDTKEPVPFENGAKGEALFTMLKGDGFVWIRQGMGDIHQIFTEPCSCGRSGFRYKVVGRADDMLKVKGIMVYPSHIKGVINEFLPKLTGEMRIILDEKPPRVVPPLKIRIEHSPEITGSKLTILEKEVIEAMSRRLKISPKILWAEAGSLERSHYKGQLFEKTYDDK